MQRIRGMQLRREAEGAVLTDAGIVANIEYSIERSYLNRYESEIRADRRLRYELDYLT